MESTNYSPVEIRRPSFRSTVVGCMDEGIHVGDGQFYFGMGGTGLSRLEGGDLKKFPIESRLLTAKVAPVAFRALNKISSDLGLPINYTSHHGCGWAAAQGFETDEEVVHETAQMIGQFSEDDVNYAGHITPSEHLLSLTATADACLKRFSHEHVAKGIALTIGGGITRLEKEALETKNGPLFIISADWASRAFNFLPEKDIIKFLELQVRVASSIMGESRPLPIYIHNAKRINSAARDQNNVVVQRLHSTLSRILM